MDDRLFHLLDSYLENRLTSFEANELRELLRSSPEARHAFWEFFAQEGMIEDLLKESSGRDLALLESGQDGAGKIPAPVPPSSRRVRRSMIPAALAACILIAAGLWWQTRPDRSELHLNPAEVQPIATVRSFVGDVQVVDESGKTNFAKANSAIKAGQVIKVGDDDSQAEIHFADGTQVALSSGSTLRFPGANPKDKEQVHLENGSMQVQTNLPAPNGYFVLTTDHARLAPARTRFRLYCEKDSSRVELEEGKVRVERLSDNTSVELTQGSFVVARAEAEPMKPHIMPMSNCQLRHTFLKAGDTALFSPDGSRLVTRHNAKGWKAWNTADGKQIALAPGANQAIEGLAFTAPADTVLALSNSGIASFWKIGELSPITTRLRDKELRHGAVSPDGRWLAQAFRTGEVAIWEADPEKGTISLRRSITARPSRVALSTSGPTGPQVAVSQWGGEIHIFDVKSGLESAFFKMKQTPTPLALSADGRFVTAYANQEGLALFNQQRKTSQNLWPGQGARVSSLCFSADGEVLLAGLEDGTVRAWSTGDGRCLFVLETGDRRVSKIAANADLSLLATVGDGSCVKIWECKLP